MPHPTLTLLDPGALHPEIASQPFTAPVAACISKRRGQKYCVVHTPWERTPRITSLHRTAAAAEKKAKKENAAFRRANPGGYGHHWDACTFG